MFFDQRISMENHDKVLKTLIEELNELRRENIDLKLLATTLAEATKLSRDRESTWLFTQMNTGFIVKTDLTNGFSIEVK
jgi:hypothetical protein